jgi:hypothetical protein
MVAKYASLLPLLETPSGLIYREMALIGITALRERRLEISKTVYEEVRYRTSTSAALASVMQGIGVFFCALLLLSLILSGAYIGIVAWNKVIIAKGVINIVTATLFGCLGSIVSLLLRLAELYGLTLPIVGGTFAAVLAAILDAGIIKVGDVTEVYIVFGFLSGFSERFTRNILTLAEDGLLGKRG